MVDPVWPRCRPCRGLYGSARCTPGSVLSAPTPGCEPCQEGSPAGAAGVREGDLLHQVNGQDVKTLEDLNQAVKDRGGAVVLMIGREGQSFILSLSGGE